VLRENKERDMQPVKVMQMVTQTGKRERDQRAGGYLGLF